MITRRAFWFVFRRLKRNACSGWKREGGVEVIYSREECGFMCMNKVEVHALRRSSELVVEPSTMKPPAEDEYDSESPLLTPFSPPLFSSSVARLLDRTHLLLRPESLSAPCD